jgi:hypothetical protein
MGRRGRLEIARAPPGHSAASWRALWDHSQAPMQPPLQAGLVATKADEGLHSTPQTKLVPRRSPRPVSRAPPAAGLKKPNNITLLPLPSHSQGRHRLDHNPRVGNIGCCRLRTFDLP